jgi:hypothetical protein
MYSRKGWFSERFPELYKIYLHLEITKKKSEEKEVDNGEKENYRDSD